jgi:hypothetical protein
MGDLAMVAGFALAVLRRHELVGSARVPTALRSLNAAKTFQRMRLWSESFPSSLYRLGVDFPSDAVKSRRSTSACGDW